MSENKSDGGSNMYEFTVSELSQSLKRTVEDTFGHVRVRAEISGLKRAASGHVYLTLKDEKAVLDGIMWRGVASKLSFRPEDGLEVVCIGKLTTYPGRSKYQIVIEAMEPAGAGALMALLEERKKKLAAEGLFDTSRKQALPYIPTTIGVVTSPTGAVIRDILHRLRDRFPRHVLLWPVVVQGEAAAGQIAAAINGFNNLPEDGDVPKPDLLIVARGGGSLEDLWAFNEEEVVRAAAASKIPLISAVGHETDTTLIDYAADRRAPTPTAAAEMAVPVRSELLGYVGDLERRMRRAALRSIEARVERVQGLGRGLRDPKTMLAEKWQHLDHLQSRLARSVTNGLALKRQKFDSVAGRLRKETLLRPVAEHKRQLARHQGLMSRSVVQKIALARQRLDGKAQLLESLSFKNVLDRGYSFVEDSDGKVVSSVKGAVAGKNVRIHFTDGQTGAVFTGDDKVPATKKTTSKKAAPKSPAADQGKLF